MPSNLPVIGFELARQFLTNGFGTVMMADGQSLSEAARNLDGLGGTPIPLQDDPALTGHRRRRR